MLEFLQLVQQIVSALQTSRAEISKLILLLIILLVLSACHMLQPINIETTISASAIDTFPVTFSTDSNFTPKSLSPIVGLKSSAVAEPALSYIP